MTTMAVAPTGFAGGRRGERRRRARPLRAAAQPGVRREARGIGHSGGVIRTPLDRLRRFLVLLAALTGLLLASAGACDTAAAPTAPPATVAPGDSGPDDSTDDSDDSTDDSTDDSPGDSPDDSDDGGPDDSGDDGTESEGPDDGALSGQGNSGESR